MHNRVNLYLIQAIPNEHLTDVSTSKGRIVDEQIAHVHNVRLMWLQQAAPDLFATLTKLERGTPVSKTELLQHLSDSSTAIASLLERDLNEGRIKGFKPHPVGFLGYLIAHESHHRGQIAL
ncbi:MAG: DinB family protein, partial [Rudanella sp.]|nr:DinB family protein [Rudanella sp.]